MNSTPETVNELLEQNQQPIPPEELFEQLKKLETTDQQLFSGNTVQHLIRFHEFVINELDTDDKTLPIWISDLEKLKMCSHLLNSLSD